MEDEELMEKIEGLIEIKKDYYEMVKEIHNNWEQFSEVTKEWLQELVYRRYIP